MKLRLMAESGRALLEVLDTNLQPVAGTDGKPIIHVIPAAAAIFEVRDVRVARMAGEDGQAIKFLLCNVDAERSIDVELLNPEGVEERYALRPRWPNEVGSSLVLDCWDGDHVLVRAIAPVAAAEPVRSTEVEPEPA